MIMNFANGFRKKRGYTEYFDFVGLLFQWNGVRDTDFFQVGGFKGLIRFAAEHRVGTDSAY